MSATEIILIVIGVAIFLLGYLMPARRKDLDEEVQLIGEDEVRRLVAGEVEHVKDRIADIVEETVSYSIEKTERAMERMANEKIMAVNEYSDTVLEEINKNHKEVVFLYDMLNDKHDNLMSTINDATIAADEIKQTVKDSDITVREVPEKIEAIMQAADEMEELIKDAEKAAMQAQKAAQDAVYSVINAVENAKKDLAVIQEAKSYQKTVTEEMQGVIEEEEIPARMYEEELPVAPEEDEVTVETVLEEAAVETWNEADEALMGSVEDELVEPTEEVEDFKPIQPKRVEIIHQPDGDYVAENEEELSTSAAFASMGFFAPKQGEIEEPRRKARTKKSSPRSRVQDNAPFVDIQFAQGKDNSSNSNERILALHKAGKSNMAIARELGLGLGEVKLVIDLFEGM